MPDRDLSGHPVDRLIHELIQSRRHADPEEIARILDRIATARFDPRLVRVPVEERGIAYGSRQLLPWDHSLFVHLVRRVVLDQQWTMGTTAEEYVQDLHRAARVGGVRLVVYTRRGGAIAGILAPTTSAVPAVRLGSGTSQLLFVVYSADRGFIISGYHVPSRDALAIPEDAQWLL